MDTLACKQVELEKLKEVPKSAPRYRTAPRPAPAQYAVAVAPVGVTASRRVPRPAAALPAAALISICWMLRRVCVVVCGIRCAWRAAHTTPARDLASIERRGLVAPVRSYERRVEANTHPHTGRYIRHTHKHTRPSHTILRSRRGRTVCSR